MRRSISPSIKKEITSCNNQNNNKRCLIISLNNEFQFVLGGYSIQTGNLKDDIENLKVLLNDKLCFILYNINEYTPKYKWVLLLWHPEKDVIADLKNKEDKLKKKNCYIKVFEKEKKYNLICNLNKLIYHNLKNNILDIIDDCDIPLFEIRNFIELEDCVNNNIKTINNNSIELKKGQLNKWDFHHSYIKSYLYGFYFLNIELRYCNTFKETDELINNIKLLTEENNMSLNLFTIDINNYTINTDHIKINSIEVVKEITQKDIFYVVYKIFETYTFFFFCDENCPNKIKFLYSFFKPQLIEFLKKKNINIFLSVEINKVKYLIDFINSDLKKKLDSLENILLKKKKTIITQQNNNEDITSSDESNILKNEILDKKSDANKSKLLKIMYSSSKGSMLTFKRSNTMNSLKDKNSLEKKKLPTDKKDITKFNIKKSFSLKKKKIISTDKIKSISLEKKKLLKIFNFKMSTEKKEPLNLKKKKISISEKKKSSAKIEKTKTLKVYQNNKIPKFVMSRSLTFNKIASLSFEMKKSFALNKYTSLNLDKIRGSNNLFTKTISLKNLKKITIPKKLVKDERSDKNKEKNKQTENNRSEDKDKQNEKNNKKEKKKKKYISNK
ncbi:conserved Plasmodium protein, unknown function [Plasmodium gallinaceum]|uniref:ADF-H domain-containing protein n=1 Tax=Plasmodium gallinaceum TaxID=5849 RepID=A0A1J1GWT6_PLAGA|nr:conserved Plasmodium protein, unknown function [Plasmodium gallinaceum]CRG97019.1 conserved Plasmodium protein, unknown function [Plasmodium gallinaceum]